ncbi:MAG: insulinase family protein [Methylococcales bacterium]|nr:insulinase family protein [Methylococcales bacterium]
MRYKLLLGLVLLQFQSIAVAKNIVQEFHFNNGMKLVVKEDHRAPVVVSQVWYKVGSSYEYSGITGLSHFLEHMMFKGTKEYPSGQFSKIISENGGRENAFTGKDYTAYFQRLEKDRLEISFKLESDRMKNIIFKEEDFAKEIKVVMEERRLRTEDNPQALVYEQMMASAYLSNTYRNPVIGWMNDLENITMEDMKDWYQRWYSPNNATIVVVGDVDPEKVYILAKKYFGDIKSEKINKPKPNKEVQQLGTKRITVKVPAKLPYVLLGYKVPVVKNAAEIWEPYALEVLAGILDGGNSSRLSKNLIRGSQIAADASSGYNSFSRMPSMLLLDGTPSQDHTLKEVEVSLINEVTKLKTTLVTEDELKRVKAKVVADKVYEQDSMFYQAMNIGILETIGLNWRIADNYVAQIRAITAEQIQQVAKKYLVSDRLTVATLEPQPMNTKPKKRKVTGGRHAH